ncbi:MAG: bacteriocin transporter [Alphaproteobacteria bacterium]|nr:bacteriocin transporter [Alphaproteobacteria bacterium]
MAMLTVGDPVPWFVIPSSVGEDLRIDLLGGARLVVVFLGSLGDERAASLWAGLSARDAELRARDIELIGVSTDDADCERHARRYPSGKPIMLWDRSRRASMAFGIPSVVSAGGAGEPPVLPVFLLERGLRVVDVIDLGRNDRDGLRVVQRIDALWPSGEETPPGLAPVLVMPDVLDAAMCRRLIGLWHEENDESGYSRQLADGRQVTILDDRKKRRRDRFLAQDHPLRRELLVLISRRVVPTVRRVFQYEITRVERYCIACYDAADGGFFGPHRDFSGPGSHRAFAMTLNLNTNEYEGGDLRFPEYGSRLYRPDSGSAIVFSGSLLHEARPVTFGRRFALLSFFFGDREAQLLSAYHRRHGTGYEMVDLRPGARDKAADPPVP